MVDRYLVMFIRLLSSIFKDLGSEKLDFIVCLNMLEKKLMMND